MVVKRPKGVPCVCARCLEKGPKGQLVDVSTKRAHEKADSRLKADISLRAMLKEDLNEGTTRAKRSKRKKVAGDKHPVASSSRVPFEDAHRIGSIEGSEGGGTVHDAPVGDDAPGFSQHGEESPLEDAAFQWYSDLRDFGALFPKCLMLYSLSVLHQVQNPKVMRVD